VTKATAIRLVVLALILWTSPFIYAALSDELAAGLSPPTGTVVPKPIKVPANSPVLSELPPAPAPASPGEPPPPSRWRVLPRSNP
jgi:hypothetical protein